MEEADIKAPKGQKPVKFANVRMEGIVSDARDGPYFVISFDIPARIKNMRPGEVVRCRTITT